MTDQPRPGLFSSLTMGRASRSPKPPSNNTNETLTHPLLGASTSSLNLPQADGAVAEPSNPQTIGHKSAGSSSARPGSTDLNSLPYKPRQRHGGGIGSAGSATSIFGASGTATASPTLQPASGSSTSTSPVTPTTIVSAPPTTSTSTSNTFALPPFTVDAPAQVDYSDVSAATTIGPASTALTSRLQLQSLKAAAQRIGLGNGSMGMSMIDAIFEKGQLGRAKSGEGGEWGDLLRILMGGKAILLLPVTPSSSLPMTPQTLKDHLAFLSPPVALASSSFTSKLPGNESTQVREKESLEGSTNVCVTLSGLVGTMNGTTVSFGSIIPPDSPLLQALRDATTRQSVLSSLRPTQLQSASSTAPFPSYTLSSDTAVLPFPPPSKNAPPLATSDTKEKEKAPPGKLGRINPFASLFGGNSAAPSPVLASSTSQLSAVPSSPSFKAESTLTPDRPLSPSPSRPTVGSRPSSPSPSSPKPSLLTFDHGDNASILSETASIVLAHGEGYQVTAYTVSRPIRYAETHKSLAKAIRTHVKEVLSKMPDKVIDKVIKLVVANVCPPTHTAGDDLLKNHRGNSDGDAFAALDFSDPTTTGERLQDFMEGIYDDLITHHRAEVAEGLKRKGSGNVPWGRAHSHNQAQDGDRELVKEKKERERAEQEEHVEKDASEGTEKVEAVVCRLLYNRLFSPLESDDARHDEALASRIAALNMLDLSLDHLGLITRPDDEKPEGTIAKGLADIVDRIGDELQQLSGTACLTPKDKAEVLIRAHKIVVDGLSELPNVELRPEGEPYKPPVPTTIPLEGGEVELPTVSTPETRSSGSSPSLHPLGLETDPEERASSSPAASDTSDPLTAVGNDATPFALQPNPRTSPSVPQLVLSDAASADEPSQLKEAMSDSVMTATVTARSAALSREASGSSNNSVPPPKAASTSKPGTSGADLILPIIIYSVVKSNPPQLASQLMYLRRYRSAICLTGEASYAIVNLTAVVEFIEHVDLAELGLGGDSDKVMSIDDLSPIGLNYLDESNTDAASIASASSRLRGRVFQVGELAGTAAGSANKVITGVMDSSWTALRGLIGTNANAISPDAEFGPTAAASASDASRPGMRQRQASTFSLASVTASVASIAAAAAARNRSRASSRASEHVWQGNQELQEVSSRPASVKERESEYLTSSDEGSDSSDGGQDDDDGDGDGGRGHRRIKSDVSAASHKGKDEAPKERVSLSNRLASIGVLGRLSGSSPSSGPSPLPGTGSGGTNEAGTGTPIKEEGTSSPASKPSNFLSNLTHPRSTPSSLPTASSTDKPDHAPSQTHGRRSSLLGGLEAVLKSSSPRGSIASLPLSGNPSGSGSGLGTVGLTENEPPIERFMNCEVGDIRLSEIGALLRDYRRLGNIVNRVQKQAQTPPQ